MKMPRSGVFLSCLLYVLSVRPGTTQKTFVRTCECEYVTNGKCAYTLLLPIGEGAVSTTCASEGQSTSPEDMTLIQVQIDDVRLNMTMLSDWSGSQARLLAQLQGAIIGLQGGSGVKSTPGSGEQTPGSGEQTTGSGGSPLNFDQMKLQVDNLGNNVESLRESQIASSRDIASLNVVLTDTVQRVRYIQEEAPNLRQQISEQRNTIASLGKDLQDIRGQMCEKRGLLVSGPVSSITESGITASSSFDVNHGPYKVRMNNTEAPGAWCPEEPNDVYEWIQFDLGKERIIFGTASKGRYDFEQWVTSYRVEYAVPGVENLEWKQIDDVMGESEIFPGNHDKNSIQLNLFWTPIKAQLIRIIPIGVYNKANRCMRADVIGCVDEDS